MARKPSKSPKPDSAYTGQGKKKVEWQGYVNLALTDKQKAGMPGWAEGIDIWGDHIGKLIDSGYVLSCAFDDYHQSAVAGLYCIDPGHDNAGWKLTAHAEEIEHAVYRLIYIHSVLLEGDWAQGFRPEVDSW